MPMSARGSWADESLHYLKILAPAGLVFVPKLRFSWPGFKLPAVTKIENFIKGKQPLSGMGLHFVILFSSLWKNFPYLQL